MYVLIKWYIYSNNFGNNATSWKLLSIIKAKPQQTSLDVDIGGQCIMMCHVWNIIKDNSEAKASKILECFEELYKVISLIPRFLIKG